MIILYLARAQSQSSYQRSQIQSLTAQFDVSWLKLGNSIKSSKLTSSYFKLINEHENTNNHLRKILTTDSSWESYDQMLVDLVGDGITFTGCVWYTSSSNGLFKNTMFSEGVTLSGGTYFTITCFYPSSLITDTRKQNGEVTMKALDFMFGRSSTIRSSTNTITVSLSRKMARLYLTIHFDATQITSQTLSDYTFYISGIKHDGNYYTDGSAAVNSDASIINNWDITNICTVNTASQTIACKMILFPQTLTNGITLSVVRNGHSVDEVIQIASLDSGYVYVCDITMDLVTLTFT